MSRESLKKLLKISRELPRKLPIIFEHSKRYKKERLKYIYIYIYTPTRISENLLIINQDFSEIFFMVIFLKS